MDDVLIVGGGVIGLSLAYELAGQGGRVTVVDRQMPGREASWAGAGIFPPAAAGDDADAWEQLTALSHRLHAQWAAELLELTDVDTGYRRCGGIYVARDAASRQLFDAAVSEWQRRGIEYRPLDAADLAELEPFAGWSEAAPTIEAAYLLPDECQVRNPRHLRALSAACQRRGVRVLPQTEVLGFDASAGRIQRVHTTGDPLTVGNICLTSGPWTRRLLAEVGCQVAIKPIRGQMLLLTAANPTLRCIVNEGSRYIVPRADGRTLVGSTEEDVGFDRRTTAAGVRGLLQFALDLVPGLRATTLERSWAGLRPATVDGFPYLGAVPGYDNLFVAAGHFRSGLHQSTGTAVVMSQLLCGEQPDIDLTHFRVDRH